MLATHAEVQGGRFAVAVMLSLKYKLRARGMFLTLHSSQYLCAKMN
eukprot:COSAG02_NODE_2994_length_7586_cov_3.858822_7_plen_46_part_00